MVGRHDCLGISGEHLPGRSYESTGSHCLGPGPRDRIRRRVVGLNSGGLSSRSQGSFLATLWSHKEGDQAILDLALGTMTLPYTEKAMTSAHKMSE